MSQTSRARAVKPWKILIVDDEVHILRRCAITEKNGYQVCTAATGGRRSASSRSKPDLCVLDIMLRNSTVRKCAADPQTVEYAGGMLARGPESTRSCCSRSAPTTHHEAVLHLRAARTGEGALAAARQFDEGRARDHRAHGRRPRRRRASASKAGNVVELAPKSSPCCVLLENRGRVVTRQTLSAGVGPRLRRSTDGERRRWLREGRRRPNDPQHIITVRSRGICSSERARVVVIVALALG